MHMFFFLTNVYHKITVICVMTLVKYNLITILYHMYVISVKNHAEHKSLERKMFILVNWFRIKRMSLFLSGGAARGGAASGRVTSVWMHALTRRSSGKVYVPSSSLYKVRILIFRSQIYLVFDFYIALMWLAYLYILTSTMETYTVFFLIFTPFSDWFKT